MDQGSGPNDAQAAYWEDRSGSWIESQGWWLSTVAAPFGRAAIDALDPGPGERILDVGCGTGPTTIEIARRVAPGGQVEGADISPSMVGAARANAADAGVDNATFVVADAQTADLGSDVLDGAFSQFGVMFFSDPVEAFSNVRAAIRPGGRLAFVCWQDVFSNEWMIVPGAAAMSVTGRGPDLPEPGAPGPFSLCDPERVRRVLDDARFVDVAVADVRAEVVVPDARIEDMLRGVSRMGAVREQLESTDDEATRTRIVDAVRDELRSRSHGGEVRLASAAWVVSARA